jgi:putative cardiolipin synthase
MFRTLLQSGESMKKSLLFSLLFMSFVTSAALAEEIVSIDPFNAKSMSPHKIILLNHGLSSLVDRLQMIERAKKSIDVEYFIYHPDKSGKLFTQALIKKAKEGVKVRILLDYFMIKNDFSPFYAEELEKYGIEVKYFNTTSTLNLLSGQYRNHRKILLIDGEEMITGGRNIGDEYFDLDEKYNFLDREVHLAGEIVATIKKTFDETYSSKLSKRLSKEEMPLLSDSKYSGPDLQDVNQYKYDLKIWNKKVSEAKAFMTSPLDEKLSREILEKGQMELSSEFSGTCNEMSFNSEYPNIGKRNRRGHRVIKHGIFERIVNAKKSLMIDSPYFIVNEELESALTTALGNNVKMKLLTNSLNSTDAIYVYAAFDSIATSWLNKGLDSYIFKGSRPESYDVLEEIAGQARFGVHAKTFIFDNKDVVIGTFNVDPRSANYNSEMVVACENYPDLADAVQEDINLRLHESIHLDSKAAIKEAEFYQVGFGKKLIYYFLKIPSNIFSFLL